MSSVSLGDLAHSFMLQRRSVALRENLFKLTDEMSSGRVADVREVLSGNHNYLASLERDLSTLEGYKTSTTEAGYFTKAMQGTLDRIQEFSSQLAIDMIMVGGGSVGVVASSPSENAANQLDSIIKSLNGSVAGRGMFSGTATDTPALQDADTLLTNLLPVLTGLPTPESIIAAADAWFANPAGFDASIYIGSATALAPFDLSDTESISLDVKANDDTLKEIMKYSAVAALARDPALGLSVDDQAKLFGLVGMELQAEQDQLTNLRARVGLVEARIDQIATRNQAEATSLEFARNQLLEADPFETATRLETVQFHLQSLYSITVRNSQLSLVNFL